MTKEQVFVALLFMVAIVTSVQTGYLLNQRVQYLTEPVPLATVEDVMRVMEGCK